MTQQDVLDPDDRNRRALATLYQITIACRGETELRRIFSAITTELRALFAFDACYLAVCDSDRPGFFRAAFLIDEATTIYEEDTEYGVLTGYLANQQEPLLFRDLPAERDWLPGRVLQFGSVQRSSRSWMGVPLVLGEQAIGVLSLQSYTVGVFSQDDLALLQQVGNVAAVLIENAVLAQSQRDLSLALAEQVAARTRELDLLGELAAEMVRGRPIATVLDHAIDRIVRLFAFDAGIIRLLEPDSTRLRLGAQRGMPPDYMQNREVLPVAETLLGQVIAENRVLVVGPEYAKGLGQRGLPFQSVLSVPLRIGERVLGGMSLLTRDARHFTNDESDVALALANQVALAVENARLFEERDRRVAALSTLSAIARAASTALDLNTLLREVHTALTDVLAHDAFSMVVYDPEQRIITDGVSIDEGAVYEYWRRQPAPPASLTAWVLQQRRILHFDNMPEEIDAYPELVRHLVGSGRHAVSWMGVPLLNRAGEAIGVISVQGYAPQMFSALDESFLTSVARQVALHVQNVALLERRERQIRELDAISRVSQSVSSGLSMAAMLRPVYEVLEEVTGASSFFLMICDAEQQIIQHAFFIDGGEELGFRWPGEKLPAGGLADWIVRQRQPLLFEDIHNQADELAAIGVRPIIYGINAQPRSWVGVPLLDAQSRTIGVIALQDSRPYRYDRQTVAFLVQVALHISLGVQKVGLFEAEHTARLTADTLREVARVLSATFDQDEVLEIVLHELNQVIPYDTASIMLREGAGLRVVASRGWPEGQGPEGVVFPLEHQTLAIRVLRDAKPLLLSDTLSDPAWYRTAWVPNIRSWLGIPLIAKGRTLGVLNIDALQPGRFSIRDSDVALAFANQAAVSLENARLYAESVTRVEQELAIARQIQSNLFPRTLPQVAGLSLAARCLPARETGGDFYDCFTLMVDQQPIVALMVGDASGKSVPGAMLMAIARSIARSEARDHVTPAEVMCETNRLVVADVPRGSFVAMNYATIDLQRPCIALASAGQIAPLHRRPDGTLTELFPSGPALPLGISPEVAYAALEQELSPGDTLVFVTDGVLEAHNSQREMFGFERLEQIVREQGDQPPEQLVETVLHAVEQHIGTVPQHDDMTVMVVRVDPLATFSP